MYNCLTLNIDKCTSVCYTLINTISFSRCIFFFFYYDLGLANSFKVLDKTFDSKLNFSKHSGTIQNKAMRNLRFIKRTCHSLNNPTALKTLRCSLVRSIIEYCPLIRINNTSKRNKIRRIVTI